MSRKKRKESVLQSAKIPGVDDQVALVEKKTSPFITVPLALVGVVALIFGLVKLIKWSWYF